jgi:hypothetical protein
MAVGHRRAGHGTGAKRRRVLRPRSAVSVGAPDGRVAGKVSGRGSTGGAEAKRHWTRRTRSALLGNPPATSHSLPRRFRGHDYRAASTGPSPRFPRFAGPGSAVTTYGAGAREITRAASGRATAPTTSSGVGDDPGKGGGFGTSQDARPARAAAQDSFSGLEASRSSISSTTRSWGSSAALMRYLRLPPSAGTTCTTV